MKKNFQRAKSDFCYSFNGFTLIELIIVIVISSIVAIAANSILGNMFNAYLTSKNIITAEWQGKIALERMTRDIRVIRSPTDITTANASQLTFTDHSGNSVSYSLSGSTLMRNSDALADGIQSITFSYFDKNGTTTAVTSAIRFIRITIQTTQGDTNLTLTTAVNPRNLL